MILINLQQTRFWSLLHKLVEECTLLKSSVYNLETNTSFYEQDSYSPSSTLKRSLPYLSPKEEYMWKDIKISN